MATATESLQRNPHSLHVVPPSDDAVNSRTVPIITPTIKMSPSSPTAAGPESMDITSPHTPSFSSTPSHHPYPPHHHSQPYTHSQPHHAGTPPTGPPPPHNYPPNHPQSQAQPSINIHPQLHSYSPHHLPPPPPASQAQPPQTDPARDTTTHTPSGMPNTTQPNIADQSSASSSSLSSLSSGSSSAASSSTIVPATIVPSVPRAAMSTTPPALSEVTVPAVPAAPPSAAPPTMPVPTAAPAVTQPKIVQTAFIHKLYSMLEDPAIRELIAWSQNQDSFVMAPSQEFSKVLAQYFKHTNISSFVRQLNMYGFHKVSDVFHTGSPDTVRWEFRHGGGNFRRGDIASLRDIKRRASRHTLIHRNEFPERRGGAPTQPGTPAEAMQPGQDGGDPRIGSLENTVYDIGMRNQRLEDHMHVMAVKQHSMLDHMERLLHSSQDLARVVVNMSGPDHPAYRDATAVHGEIQRTVDMFRAHQEPVEPHQQMQPYHHQPQHPHHQHHQPQHNIQQQPLPPVPPTHYPQQSHQPPHSSRAPYFSNIENPPVSPRQMPQDRLNVPRANNNYHRPPVPSNLSISTRRPYGSMAAGSTGQTSPLRSQPPPPPPAAISPQSNMNRRHTTADIRAHPNWQSATQQQHPPAGVFGGPPPPSAQWPPSPSRHNPNTEDPRLQESLSSYSLGAASHAHSRPTTPQQGSSPLDAQGPPPAGSAGIGGLQSWNWNSGDRDEKKLSVRDSSIPPNRRGSMAHILNPDHGNDDEMDEGRKSSEDGRSKRARHA